MLSCDRLDNSHLPEDRSSQSNRSTILNYQRDEKKENSESKMKQESITAAFVVRMSLLSQFNLYYT